MLLAEKIRVDVEVLDVLESSRPATPDRVRICFGVDKRHGSRAPESRHPSTLGKVVPAEVRGDEELNLWQVHVGVLNAIEM